MEKGAARKHGKTAESICVANLALDHFDTDVEERRKRAGGGNEAWVSTLKGRYHGRPFFSNRT